MGEATAFRVGDRVVDAWGRDIEEEDKSYEDMTAKELVAEIEKRNEDRADEDKIVLDGKKKSDAVAALQADDEASSDEE